MTAEGCAYAKVFRNRLSRSVAARRKEIREEEDLFIQDEK
jgi:hypothetical protein